MHQYSRLVRAAEDKNPRLAQAGKATTPRATRARRQLLSGKDAHLFQLGQRGGPDVQGRLRRHGSTRTPEALVGCSSGLLGPKPVAAGETRGPNRINAAACNKTRRRCGQVSSLPPSFQPFSHDCMSNQGPLRVVLAKPQGQRAGRYVTVTLTGSGAAGDGPVSLLARPAFWIVVAAVGVEGPGSGCWVACG